MQSLKISHVQGFCIIKLVISQSRHCYEFFFLCARSRSSSRTTYLRVRKVAAGSRVFLTGRTTSSSCSPPLVAGAAATIRIRLVSDSYQVLQRTVVMVLLAIGSGRWGVSVAIDGPDMTRRKSGSHEGPGDAHDRLFTKPCAAWHIYQVCSLICQVAQNANSKC